MTCSCSETDHYNYREVACSYNRFHCIERYYVIIGVTDLRGVFTNDTTTLSISWDPPANGNVLGYSVSIVNLEDNSVVRQEQTTRNSFTGTGFGRNVAVYVSVGHFAKST